MSLRARYSTYSTRSAELDYTIQTSEENVGYVRMRVEALLNELEDEGTIRYEYMIANNRL